MKKLYLFLFSILLIGMISAVNECNNDNSYLGTFKQGETITLRQTCNDCTYVNLSSVSYPNSTVMNYDVEMTKNGIEFSNSSNDTSLSGCYSYSVYGDKGGIKTSETIDYRITPSGQSGSSNIVFFIFIIVALYFITGLGWYMENEWVAILGGMAMIALGVYMIRNGVIIYRDWMTNYFAYITIGLGALSSIIAGISAMDK